MIKFYTALACLAFSGILSAQSLTNTDQKPSQAPSNVRQAHASTESKDVQEANIQAELPGFPQYINTGNKHADDENYEKAKEKWISENPILYSDYLRRKESESNNINTQQPK